MIRKLVVILLTGVVCLVGVIPALAQMDMETYSTLSEYEKLTGDNIEEFYEAPELRVKVAEGVLPPIEERLPKEPMVIKPMGEIGQYGGILTPTLAGGTGLQDCWFLYMQPTFALSPDLKEVVPNIVKDFEFSEDKKTLTLYLRKGMKWSDGYPFTADDILFWYEDIISNEELTPVFPIAWASGGEPMKVEKVDDYTVQFKFAAPNPRIIPKLAFYGGPPNETCKHYLEKYHIDYNSKADEIAKEEGYDNWWEAFGFHSTVWGNRDVNKPTLYPWRLSQIDAAGNKFFERNPYYWKIDTAGNQLPYIDKIVAVPVDIETVKMKILSGEVSHSISYVTAEEYPLFKENEKMGGYRTLLAGSTCISTSIFGFNYTSKDPVLRKIFNDIRFRQAASLAINREEMNEVLYFGRGVPYNASVTPDAGFYEDWMGKYYTEYDPEKANKLLDEMGLEWDSKGEYRLRSDGKTLHVVFEYWQRGKDIEFIKGYWKEIGINVTLKFDSGALWHTRGPANEFDVSATMGNAGSEVYAYGVSPIWYQPPWHGCYLGYEWASWHNTKGEKGEEPPEEIKNLFNLVEEWLVSIPGTEKYLDLGKKILTINTKGLYLIGVIGLTPNLMIYKNSLKNTPPEGVIMDYDFEMFQCYVPEQWFFTE